MNINNSTLILGASHLIPRGGGPGFDPRVFFFFSWGWSTFFFFAESGVLFFFEVNYMYILQDAIYYY